MWLCTFFTRRLSIGVSEEDMAAVTLAECTAFLARGQHGKVNSQGHRKEQHQTWTSSIFYWNETEHRHGGTESVMSVVRTVNWAKETRSVRTHVRHHIGIQRLPPKLPTPRWVRDTELRRGQRMGRVVALTGPQR